MKKEIKKFDGEINYVLYNDSNFKFGCLLLKHMHIIYNAETCIRF